MTKRMMLAALLALGAVPALAGDVSEEKKSQTVVGSSDEARVVAAKRIEAQSAQSAQKQACTCTCQRPTS